MESYMTSVAVNGRPYQFPARPTVVVCIDGGDPAYYSDGLQRGLLPALRRFQERGVLALATAVMPISLPLARCLGRQWHDTGYPAHH